jgi:putative oxidoreductase
MSLDTTAARYAPYAQALLRIVCGYLFVVHGSMKLFHVPHAAMFDGVTLMSLPGLAGVLELVGGLLLIVGLFTRVVAFLLSGEMAIAYFTAHASQGNALFPQLNQGEAAVLFCFAFLFPAGILRGAKRSRRTHPLKGAAMAGVGPATSRRMTTTVPTAYLAATESAGEPFSSLTRRPAP